MDRTVTGIFTEATSSQEQKLGELARRVIEGDEKSVTGLLGDRPTPMRDWEEQKGLIMGLT